MIILDEIPKGATGKLQRIGLAEKLGLAPTPAGAAHEDLHLRRRRHRRLHGRAKLAQAGADVSLVARGPHLAAMQAHGLTLIEDGAEPLTVPVARHAIDCRALWARRTTSSSRSRRIRCRPWWARMQPLIGPRDHHRQRRERRALVVFPQARRAAAKARGLPRVDPGDAQWNGFGPDRVLGCVVYPAAEVSEPGVIRHIEGNRFSLGEPDGSKSDRALALSQALTAAGLKAPVRPRLRDEIWVKLWGNLSFNPISALTHATLDVLCTDPGTRARGAGA